MGQTAKDAIALLKADHRKVEELFEKFEKSRSADKKEALAHEICLELTVHSMIEEEIFYPACKNNVDEYLLDESYVEHDGAKVLIEEISASGPDNEFYDAKVKVLSEMIKHHVKEEEKRSEGLFAQAKHSGLDMVMLGEKLMDRKTELLAQFKKEGLPTQKTRSYTGHKLVQSKPLESTLNM